MPPGPPDPGETWDPDGDETAACPDANPAAGELLRLLLQRPRASAVAGVHEDDRATVGAVLRHVRRHAGAMVTLRYRVRRPDGAVQEVESTIRRSADDPRMRAILGQTRDVTEAV